MTIRPSNVDVWLPFLVVAALIVFFSLASDAFLSLRNMTGILGQASTLLLACLGASFVILMGSIDLSVGAIVLLVGAITVLAINSLGLGVEALVLAVAVGSILGLANGAVYAFGRIPSFVVTLGTLSVFTGAAWELLQGRALRFTSPAFEDLAIGQAIPYIPNIALFALAAWALGILVWDEKRNKMIDPAIVLNGFDRSRPATTDTPTAATPSGRSRTSA